VTVANWTDSYWSLGGFARPGQIGGLMDRRPPTSGEAREAPHAKGRGYFARPFGCPPPSASARSRLVMRLHK
jgi:hypothetical protein